MDKACFETIRGFPLGRQQSPVVCSVLRLVVDFQNHLDFDTGTVGQRGHAHGRPGMGSGLAVQLAQ